MIHSPSPSTHTQATSCHWPCKVSHCMLHPIENPKGGAGRMDFPPFSSFSNHLWRSGKPHKQKTLQYIALRKFVHMPTSETHPQIAGRAGHPSLGHIQKHQEILMAGDPSILQTTFLPLANWPVREGMLPSNGNFGIPLVKWEMPWKCCSNMLMSLRSDVII